MNALASPLSPILRVAPWRRTGTTSPPPRQPRLHGRGGRERTGGDRNVAADIPEFSGARGLNVQTAGERPLVHFSSSIISDWWKGIAPLAR